MTLLVEQISLESFHISPKKEIEHQPELVNNHQQQEVSTKLEVSLMERYIDKQLQKIAKVSKTTREIKAYNKANPDGKQIPLPNTGEWNIFYYPSIGRTTLTLTTKGEKKPKWEVFAQEVPPETGGSRLVGRWMKVSGPLGIAEITIPYPTTSSRELSPQFSFIGNSSESNGQGSPQRLARQLIRDFGSLDISFTAHPDQLESAAAIRGIVFNGKRP